MTWFKVCDTLWGHDKAEAAGLEAMGLWVLAGSKCGQQLTDGFVSHQSVAKCGGTPEIAARLVKAGLWVEVEGGYLFHDWTDNNPTRAEIEGRREADRLRKASARNPNGHRTESAGSHAGFPVGSGGSKNYQTKPGFRADSARTHQPPSIHALCDHGKESGVCPWCKAEAAS